MAGREESERSRAVADLLLANHDQLLETFSTQDRSGYRSPLRLLQTLQCRLRSEGYPQLVRAPTPSARQARDGAPGGAGLAAYLRELAQLRAAIFELCERHELPLHGPAARLVQEVLDEAMFEAAEQAEAAAAEFSAIIQSIPDAVYVGDASGIHYCNQVALDRLGLKDLSELRRPIAELHALFDVRSLESGERLSPTQSGFMRALSGSSSSEEVLARNVSNGETLMLRATYAPVRHGDAVIAAVTVQSDITEQKRLEGRRDRLHVLEQRARAEAENANRIKDDFIATVSHELRTPLSAILGWARLLGVGNLSAEKQLQAIQIVERNAKAQAHLIEDLLDVSRILSGKLRLEVTLLEPVDVVEAALDVVRSTADAKGVKLESILDPQAGPLKGDADRLQQVVWNLLTNAVKFTPKGGRVQVRLMRIDASVELVVQDNGQGIDPDFLPFVFEKFRQAETAASKTHRGLGLGLSIVKYLVEAHGGTIRAASAGTGQGAEFRVRFPLSPVCLTPVPTKSQPSRSSLPPWIDSPPGLAGLKILVVDDEEDARSLLATVLEQCKVIVSTARDVPDALARFRELRPDMIVSDIGMPGATGYDLIRAIRSLSVSDGGSTPAVALTAYARSEDRMKALAHGFNMHVPKPIEPAELLVVLASVVERTNLPSSG
ncbi:MAG: hypothetical protein JWN04_6767 [Myxococcaceae bacterium]|nr:hypothetical protein [Myxococcaceae bacterium]